MRFADIACGSGSFLIGVYDYLLRYHTDFYNQKKNRNAAAKAGCIVTDAGGFRLSLEQRTNILLNNVYGVDVDAQAVEVSQLSLFLKLLEDETTSSARLYQQQKLKLLPTLENNIICGNALIDWDIESGQLFENKELRKLNPMSYADKFPEIMRAGGFDAIVGNPPYGAEILAQQIAYLKQNFVSASYQIDTYPLFVEKSLSLIKQNALTGLIIPSAWIASKYNLSLRELLANKTKVESVVITPKKVFQDATVETLVLVFSNKETVSNQISVERWDKLEKEFYLLHQDKVKSNADYIFPVYSSPAINDLIDKIQSNSIRISKIGNAVWGVKIYQRGKGVPPQKGYESEERLFHSKFNTKETHRPLIGGSEIKRYFKQWNGEFVDYGKWLAEPRDSSWFEGKRILIREVTSKGVIEATIVEGNFVFSNSVDGLKIDESFGYKYLFILGLINSKLMSFYNANTSANAFKDTFPKVLIKDLLNFPVCIINFDDKQDAAQHAKMIQLVEAMLAAKKELPNAVTDREQTFYRDKCNRLDREIDRLVYELYDLTADEIAIVENAAK